MAEHRPALAEADVARDEKRLFQRHVEPGLLGEFQNHHFLGGGLAVGGVRARNPARLQSLITGQPVFQVNDEFALGELGEIDL